MDARVKILPAAPEHAEGWRALWDLYGGGQELAVVTWQRIVDQNSGVGCLVASVGQEVAGFLTYVQHPSTSEIKDVCYVEDLYVAKPYRGTAYDIAHGLVAQIMMRLNDGEWSRVYGITRQHNRSAQKLYERFTPGEPWMRYLVKASPEV